MTERDLMRQVSLVFQDVYLFNQSIRDNIKIGIPEASDEEVVRAAKAACCNEFIESLPNGYDTVLGEGGVHLSGGEAQRISIARAIIRNTPILVLDEATAFHLPARDRPLPRGACAHVDRYCRARLRLRRRYARVGAQLLL